MLNDRTITFDEVTREELSTLIAELTKNGCHVAVQGDGIMLIDGHGIKATVTCKDELLTVAVNSKPFWMPYAGIEHGLKNALGRKEVNGNEKLENDPRGSGGCVGPDSQRSGTK